MHDTALIFAQKFFETYLVEKKDLRIADLGSCNVNGDIKEIFSKSHEYIGLDLEKGPNVDIVMSDPYKIPLEDNSVDIVISTSCFEHSEMFWLVFNEIQRILKPNGLFYLNAPSNGPYHAYPVDCYRFYPDSGKALAKWSNVSGFNNVIMIESFTGIQKDDVWNDFVAIFLKDKKFINEYPDRIIKKLNSEFYNGKVYNVDETINLTFKPEDQVYENLKYTSHTEYLLYRAINKIFRNIYRLFK